MRPMCERDIAGLLSDHGFADITIRPMEEKPGALGTDPRGLAPEWRVPWTVIAGRRRD